MFLATQGDPISCCSRGQPKIGAPRLRCYGDAAICLTNFHQFCSDNIQRIGPLFYRVPSFKKGISDKYGKIIRRRAPCHPGSEGLTH